MAVKIRLQRHGSKHAPVYRLVAADSRSPRDGRFVEILGTYNPKAKRSEEELRLKTDRVDYWLGVGAQPSDTARSLIRRAKREAAQEPSVADEAPSPAKPAAPEPKPAAPAVAVSESGTASTDEAPIRAGENTLGEAVPRRSQQDHKSPGSTEAKPTSSRQKAVETPAQTEENSEAAKTVETVAEPGEKSTPESPSAEKSEKPMGSLTESETAKVGEETTDPDGGAPEDDPESPKLNPQ